MIGSPKRFGMIAGVSPRLLYVIFQQMLGLILLTPRMSAANDVELLVLRHAERYRPDLWA